MTALFLITVLNVQAQPRNTHFSHTLETAASAKKIWQIWTDVPTWQDWDSGLLSATLFGSFQQGTKGILIPDKGPKARFVIDSLEENRSYTIKTKLPFGSLHVKRYLTVQAGRTCFTHEVWFTGLTRGLFGRTLGKRYRKLLPAVMQKIAVLAETRLWFGGSLSTSSFLVWPGCHPVSNGRIMSVCFDNEFIWTITQLVPPTLTE